MSHFDVLFYAASEKPPKTNKPYTAIVFLSDYVV